MDRFAAYLLVRRHLKRPESRNQALAVEAIMEEIAGTLGQPVDPWGVLGLLSQLDLEYAEQNPEARGRTAREQAEVEGLDPDQARHLEQWCASLRPRAEAPGELEPVERALLAATLLAEETLGRNLAAEEAAEALTHDLELLRQGGDTRGNALDAALSGLSLETRAAAGSAVRALKRVAQDLR